MGSLQLQKAYKNIPFLNSPDARLIRFLAEYLEPEARLKREQVQDAVVFFGSARTLPLELARYQWEEHQQRLGRGEVHLDDPDTHALKYSLKLSEYYQTARECARQLTSWSRTLSSKKHRFMVCSGGGPGMMEAANRGATEAGGKSIALNISLPFEQEPNRYVDPELAFEFHYFFMRKFWFVYLARAMVILPGGYGTLDEMMEVLTLIQTRKLKKQLPVVLIGEEYWNDVLDFEAMTRWGTISEQDLDLFHTTDDADEAFAFLHDQLTRLYLNNNHGI